MALGVLDGNYKEIHQAVTCLNEIEYRFCMQRVKVAYFKQVDHNSSLFHDLVKQNNRRNEITVVEQPDGSFTMSFSDVVQIFTEHFQCQLGTTID